MVSIDTLFDKVKKWISSFVEGNGYTNMMTGYMTGELQSLVFALILASFFRIFSIPLGMVLLIAAIAGTLYFAPLIVTLEKENSNDLNRVLYWVVIYFAIIIAVTLWGG
ncbi:MAG: DUF4407 domain-containing protein [Candidatus Methanomethyliaceae archaeon]|nr:DUF4407 domain-containing protein [Candidatus Methanomethyliaceae archaeon]